ncbi:MAG: hypothetical protein LBL00_07245 [Endomicrobium sp.]|jgi:3-deoxy-D-manno-octulosonic-acid transferase|nr:hypothetical protein [Endomicrobium sp.]
MTTIFLIIYNIILLLLLLPALFFILVFSGKYRKEIFYKISERFSLWDYSSKTKSKKTVWVHCSSLGEVRAVEPVLDCLKQEYNIALTTITKTGREYAEKIQKADFTALLPVDLYPFMIKAFKIIKPDMLVLVETELWASMLYAAGRQKVKIITVNGRMSAKSFKVYNALKFFWKRFIGFINIVLARSRDDADRFMSLTGAKTEIYVSGNIKYDRDFAVKSSRADFGLADSDKVFTAGSIREGEDEIIARAYLKIKETMPDIYFFAAPRHLSKIKNVKKTLDDKKIKYSLFSEMLKGKKPDNRFILVDVFGKLQSIYSVSDICFVGGSLVNKGGQNPIEPAAFAKPVLFGKNMDNFKAESEILLKYGGGITVFDAVDIAAKIEKLLLNKNFLVKTGESALHAVKSQKGAVDITVNAIKGRLN